MCTGDSWRSQKLGMVLQERLQGKLIRRIGRM